MPQVTYTTNTGSSTTLDITVDPVDDASVLAADSQTVDEDNAATGNAPPVAIRILGPEIDTLRDLAGQVEDLIKQQAGTREPLAPGAALLHGFALGVAPALLQAVDDAHRWVALAGTETGAVKAENPSYDSTSPGAGGVATNPCERCWA